MRRIPIPWYAAVSIALLLITPPASVPVFSQAVATAPITRPVIAEADSPVEEISPVARDGHAGRALLRKPPGNGPFPAVVWIHGGLATFSPVMLRRIALDTPNPSRFLAAGYVVAVSTYRGREDDPQSKVSLEDSLAVVEHLRKTPYVDPQSIVVSGCSGGGDLALEVAAATDVAAIAAEEPATMLFTGIFNRESPKAGERFTPLDTEPLYQDPRSHYTPKYQQLTREKIKRLRAPVLIQQGDQHPINRFNAEIFLAELQASGKPREVITYPGEQHCFAMNPRGTAEARIAAVLKAFQDADRFFRRYLKTAPKPVDAKLVTHVPIPGKLPEPSAPTLARLLDAQRDSATFSDPATGQLLRKRVIEVLRLGTR